MEARTTTQGRGPFGPVARRRINERIVSAPGYERLKSAGEMGGLGIKVIRQAFTPPFTWVPEAVVEFSTSVRRCLLPMAISHIVYVLAFGIILFGLVVSQLGLGDRQMGAMLLIWDREIATWITAMVFAGVVGSAITADLGARKIREELDALDVLGVDKIRTLVLPRVIALTIAAPVLTLIAIFIVLLFDFIYAPGELGFPPAVLLEVMKQLIDPLDLFIPTLLKNTIIGFFVGVVACYKGLSSSGGAEGVGRAVNQSVVITFFGIWLFNSLFNLGYLTLFPDVANLRG